MPKTILVTGGCGFIGHHFVEHILKSTDWNIKILDRLGYSSRGFERIRDIEAFDNKRVFIFTGRFDLSLDGYYSKELSDVNYIVHMGAETHVDNSITDPYPFVHSNVLGTLNMLELARKLDNLEAFFYFSTDEVFGPASAGYDFKEWDRYNSTNPYSATKAGGEELCLAYANMYKIPMLITHTMNAFGERQHPEKFIPNTVRKVLAGETVTIHSNKSKTKAGSRFYIHCRNIADAVLFLINNEARPDLRDKYNIVGEQEVDNLELARFISEVLDKPLNYEMVDFHSSRPGHDLRYALDGSKMKRLGWQPPKDFHSSLRKTILWSIDERNKHWIDW